MQQRVVFYARVSTKDQSCDLQLRDLRAFCSARGSTVTREYIDIGQSGAKDSRPELNELMADARKRKFDVIMVWRFDRFARSTKHLLLALEEFRSLGIQFISYQENIDTSSPLGQALFTIVSAVAQLERDLIRERVFAGIQNAKACGKQLGRPRIPDANLAVAHRSTRWRHARKAVSPVMTLSSPPSSESPDRHFLEPGSLVTGELNRLEDKKIVGPSSRPRGSRG